MANPVKTTHEIINLAGKLDWCAQKQNIDGMQEAIDNLRKKINQVQSFIRKYEPESYNNTGK